MTYFDHVIINKCIWKDVLHLDCDKIMSKCKVGQVYNQSGQSYWGMQHLIIVKTKYVYISYIIN